MNIVITGASGHTGSRLAAQLVRKGHAVAAVSRSEAKLREALPEDVKTRVAFVPGDLIADSAEAVAGRVGFSGNPDAVVAVTHIRFAPQIVALARALGVRRIVLMSSTRRFTAFPEETARAVIAGEATVESSGLDYTVIRPSMIYGGDRDNNLTHLVAVLRKYPVHPMPAGGRMRWQPVFTWDVVAAVCAALDRPETSIGKMYTVAGPDPMTYREMVEIILRAMGRRVWLLPIPIGVISGLCKCAGAVTGKAPLKPDQIARLQEDKVFDIREALGELGYSPTSFAEGIRRKLEGSA